MQTLEDRALDVARGVLTSVGMQHGFSINNSLYVRGGHRVRPTTHALHGETPFFEAGKHVRTEFATGNVRHGEIFFMKWRTTANACAKSQIHLWVSPK